MENFENLTLDDVIDIIPDFPYKPLERRVIITINNVEEEDAISIGSGMDEFQYVVAVGEYVKSVKPADKVLIDMSRLSKPVVDEETGEKSYVASIRPIKAFNRYFALIPDNLIEAVEI